MEITKSNLSTHGHHLNISVPFSKFDVENRIVSGFATADNIDRGSDIVLAEASARAFERFRGNIREMHDKIAAGRMVSFSQEEIYDPETGKFYNGIYVSCYISKGAESTWEKVLDGTLSAFSIGGEIKESEPFIDPETNKSVRIIKDYDLVELSIVDSPMNQLSNVMSVIKSENGFALKGMVAETATSNVFWCSSDNVAKVSDSESMDCVCGNQMQSIGWIESSDIDKADSVSEVLNKFLKSEKSLQKTNEGGIEMAETELIAEVDSVEVSSATEVPVVEEDSNVEKAVVISEVDDDAAEATPDADQAEEATEETPDTEEAAVTEKSVSLDASVVDELKSFIQSTIAELVSNNSTTIANFNHSIATLESRVDDITKQFSDSVSNVTSKVDEVSGKIGELSDAVEKVDKDTAIKKSDDLGGSTAVTKKDNIWGGSFLDAASL